MFSEEIYHPVEKSRSPLMEYFVASVCLLIKYWKNLILHVTQITKTLTESRRNEMNHSLKLFANKETPHMSSTQKKKKKKGTCWINQLQIQSAEVVARLCEACQDVTVLLSGLRAYSVLSSGKPNLSSRLNHTATRFHPFHRWLCARRAGDRRGGVMCGCLWCFICENLAESWSFLTQPGKKQKKFNVTRHRGSKRCKFFACENSEQWKFRVSAPVNITPCAFAEAVSKKGKQPTAWCM